MAIRNSDFEVIARVDAYHYIVSFRQSYYFESLLE